MQTFQLPIPFHGNLFHIFIYVYLHKETQGQQIDFCSKMFHRKILGNDKRLHHILSLVIHNQVKLP